jgi:hypothetical protein
MRREGMSVQSACKACGHEVADWLDFGVQALTNRFLRTPDETEYRHPLAIGACPACATVQLRDVAPVAELRPRFSWITYSEPEAHLDNLVEVVRTLPGVNANSRFAGLTSFDASTLRRLREAGFGNTWMADPAIDMGIRATSFGTESIQEQLTPTTAHRLVERHGQPSVVVLRYVLEHAHDVHALLRCLRELVAPTGHVVLEVPDARGALEQIDCSTVWEEHVYYFTPNTLRSLVERAGFEVVYLNTFACALDHPLVAILKSADEGRSATPTDAVEESCRARRFIDEFPRVRTTMHGHLLRLRRESGKLAFLGAGHLSAAFINLLGVGDLFDVVVDDNPGKQGLFMPGSRLPIRPTSELIARGIATCVMGVRLEVEDAVIRKNQRFVESGGTFASIFPSSPRSLWTGDALRRAS